jgi:Na+/H+ antiporter NhaA
MARFFFLIGLEIKREVLVAALVGVVFPEPRPAPARARAGGT